LASKYTFQFVSEDRRRPLPHKLLLALTPNESTRHIGLKLLAYILFFRERLQVETEVPDESIPFVPDLVELGYDLRPKLWIECGDCGTSKLHKLSVKCSETEIWCLKRSVSEADGLLRNMAKDGLRRGRFGVIAFEHDFFEDFLRILEERNEIHWYRGGFAGENGLEAPGMQFELNGLWFESSFHVWNF
jgi:hypothetical protein